MKLIITGGTLQAEVQGDPLDPVRQQVMRLAGMNREDVIRISDTVTEEKQKAMNRFRQTQEELSGIKAYIQQISMLKDDRIDRLYGELDDRMKTDAVEVGELKNIVAELANAIKDARTNTQEVDNVKSTVDALSAEHNSIIERLNQKIDKITKDKEESVSRLREELKRVTANGDKTIQSLKEKARPQPPPPRPQYPKSSEVKPTSKDGKKYMGKLNWKPKLPI